MQIFYRTVKWLLRWWESWWPARSGSPLSRFCSICYWSRRCTYLNQYIQKAWAWFRKSSKLCNQLYNSNTIIDSR
jgi:hypothetical protein